MGRVAATLDRKSAVDLANTNASWSKPLKTLGCGFYKTEAPQGCEKNVTYYSRRHEWLNHALLCAVHNSKAKSLPGMPGRTAEPYLHLTMDSDEVDDANTHKPLRCFIESGFPLELTVLYKKRDLRTFECARNIDLMCATIDSKCVVLKPYRANVVVVLEDSGRRIMLENSENVTAMCVTPENTIVTGATDGVVRVWSMNGVHLRSFKAHEGVINAVCVSSNGNIVTASRNVCCVWGDQNAVVCKYTGDRAVFSVCVTNNGKRLVVGCYGMAYVCHLKKDKPIVPYKTLNIPLKWVSSVCVTPDDKHVVTASSDDYKARVWNMDSDENEPMLTLNPNEALLTSVCVTLDGKHVVTSSEKSAHLWRLADGALVTTIDHGNVVLTAHNLVCVTAAHVVTCSQQINQSKVRKWPVSHSVVGVEPTRMIPLQYNGHEI